MIIFVWIMTKIIWELLENKMAMFPNILKLFV